MDKKILYGADAQEKLNTGINILAGAVKTTLGARGRNVLIEDLYGGSPHITKDGVTVAKAIEVSDPAQSQGVKLMKDVALNTNNQVGDGTTTSIVLAQALVNRGLKAVSQGANPIALQRGMLKGVKHVCEALDKRAKKVDGNKDFITQIASISANNDDKLGETISDAFDKVGKHGVIKVQPSKNHETYIEHIQGMQFESGLMNMMFIDPNKRSMSFDTPKILVTDRVIKKVSDFGKSDSTNLLSKVINSNETLIIICEDMDDSMLQQLILHRKTQNTSIFVIKAPEYGEERTAALEDIAIITGAKFITKDLDMKLDNVSMEDLGTCETLETDTEATTISGGQGNISEILERIEAVNTQIIVEELEHKKTKLQERAAKLSGGVAVLHIGANSEVELKEVMDRVEDAINATKAAIEQGVVVGGGLALFAIGNTASSDLEAMSDEEFEGFNLVLNCLAAPIMCILENAGEDTQNILNLITVEDYKVGFDVKNRVIGDMFELGIIDPVKVTKSALTNAASVASTLLTTQCLITNVEEENEALSL